MLLALLTAFACTPPDEVPDTQGPDLDGLRVRFDADAIGVAGAPLPAFASAVYLSASELPPERWPKHGLGDWTILSA